MRELQENVGHIANQRDGLLDGVDQDRRRFGFRAAFRAEDGFDRREIEGIDGEAVESVGRYGDNFASFDVSRGVSDGFGSGAVGEIFRTSTGKCTLSAGASPCAATESSITAQRESSERGRG